MTISIDLNGGASGSDATTAFTEQSIVSLFSSAALSANGGDSNSIDTVTLTLASATGTESLSLNAAASSAATSAGIAVNYNSGTGVLTLSGSNELTSDWQTILRGVQYDNTSDAPTGPRTVTVVANNGVNSSTPRTDTINITAVNDAPVATITPTSYSATEQTSLNLKNTGLSISDVDAGSSSVSVTLSVTEGALNVAAGTSGATVSNSGTSSVTITGTVAQINALLSTNATSTVSYIDNTDAPGASATLTLNVNDNGNSGGGSLQSSDTATISIAAVNDAPVATITPTSYSATEQTSLNLKNTGLSISDVDAGSSSVSVTLSVTEGALNVTAGTSGAAVSNSGASSVTITGTVAQINALLSTDAGSAVSYIDNTDAPGASATLTLNVNDNGNTGGGSLQSSDTATINIAAVNDAPVATDDAATLAEGGAVTTLNVLANDSDVDSTLTAASITGFSQGAHGSVVYNNDGTFTYTHDGSETTSDSFSYTITDGAGGTTTATVNLTVTPVNDTPVAVADSKAITEDTAPNPVSGNVLTNDTDADMLDTLTVTAVNGQVGNVGVDITGVYGTLHLNGDGSYTYTLDNGLESVQALAGQQVTDVFSYTAADNHGASSSADLTINILGTNDAAVLSADVSDLSETDTAGDISTAGTLTISDVDSPASFVAQAGTIGSYGTFAIDSAGAWTYTASSEHNEFEDGTTYTDTFAVASADGTLSSVKINILGTNDAPVMANIIPDQTLGRDAFWSFQVPANTFFDADSALTLNATLGSGDPLPDWLTFADGTRTFSGTPPLGFSGSLQLRVTASDGTLNASDTFDLTVLASGSSDQPIVLSPNADTYIASDLGELINGMAGNDTITGGPGNDRINGNAGDDTLDGGSGIDILSGGAGNDTYFVNNTGDVVIENAGEGTDTVFSTVHYRLSENVESLVMQGNTDLQGYGNSDANTLYGNAGNNLLSGGAGADTMIGGAGNDAYFVDNAADAVIENAGQGTDTVYSTAHLRLLANVEHLVLQGGADLQGYGNDLTNAITGNSGNNILDGGAGADAMYGGAGNDAYFVDNAGDAVIENAGQGTDTVYSTAHLRLAANVENLILQGSADLQGYGNSDANTLYGNAGNNLLSGEAGADTMFGGAGNDVYFVDNSGDLVFENANEGTDAVFATVNYTLTANVETLVLQGAGDLSGTGNALDNKVYGNAGDNALNGGAGADMLNGGAGHDTLTGGTGNDTFVFGVGQANGDTIVDFDGQGAAAGDSLQFVGYGPGATFTQNDATHWQIDYNGGSSHELITFMNGAAVHASDWHFV